MDPEERYELIIPYLEGELDASQKAEFELALQHDSQLAQETEEYRLILQTLESKHRSNSLKPVLEAIHQEMDETPEEKEKASHFKIYLPHPRNIWKKYASTIAVAASVALISVLTTMYMLDNVRSLEQKQSTNYRSLRRDLNAVKRTQNRIVRNQKKEAIKEKQPVRQYGATAFVIAANGYLVTNYHVVKNADSIYVETRRDTLLRFPVVEVFSDRKRDLSILKIEDPEFIGFAELPYTFREEEADLGEPVYTLAYPRREIVYGEGSVSAHSGYLGDTATYQISIPVNPGNSGGPLLDEYGNLLGIVSGKHTNMDGAAFAVKARYLRAAVDSLQSQNTDHQLWMPQKNAIQFLKRPEQVKRLQDFVFIVKVYNSRD